ncbi:MAG: hypothetical protein LBC77_03055 [Spirochaetaceae bacterium]|jgi:hypothetical protein|nr:hypothetical protein [Spirochaetaceae bacterium]
MAEKSISAAQELFYHLISKVIEEKINSFSDLRSYVATTAPAALTDKRYYEMISKISSVIRRMNWGFFTGLEKEKHQRLWEILVLEDKQWKDTGDLKKSSALAGLCVASMNIRGYTQFCNTNKARLKNLHIFDRAVNDQAQLIADACFSICKFERGDEMIVVSANAADCVLATISLMDFFSGARTFADSGIDTERKGMAGILPDFQTSAGIAGGQTPLVISETGNIYGPLLDAAICLQARAVEHSPDDACIFSTKTIVMLLEKMDINRKGILLKENALKFFDMGKIMNNGVQLLSVEILFNDAQKYKCAFFDEFEKLSNALQQGLWERNVFTCLLNLVIKALNTMPLFEFNYRGKDGKIEKLNNHVLEHQFMIALNSFLHKQNYFKAVDVLCNAAEKLKAVPAFDKRIRNFTIDISERYRKIISEYEEMVETLIEENKNDLFSERDLAIYTTLKKNISVYDKLRLNARDNPKLKQRSKYWALVINKNKELFAPEKSDE